ncbi:N-glycosidase F, putative [Labilithrix luteola]|uniref:N-glycosidase F, putative n=1 Tax=Labilithrix luteola TaxID=1391654 RepID=A0A0K1Q454_9BACT|nr:peptide-N-glycosidase F-related protein [Labilithrix luteola]AKV00165.1 N-glycosidase F, putative [Labilithrix luteola]
MRHALPLLLTALVPLLAFACSESIPTPVEASPDAGVGEIEAGAGDGAPGPTFLDGPYGTMPRDVAGPFTVATSDGTLSFRDAWTGEDHWMFVGYAPNTMSDGSGDYSLGLFAGSVGVRKLIAESPKNAHYVFFWYKDQPGFEAFEARVRGVIDGLSEADREHWSQRFHFVTEKVDQVEGWFGDMVRDRLAAPLVVKRFDPFQFAVDRTQHVREVGMLGQLTTKGQSTELSFLASEPVYYEYEHARDARLAASKATVVELLKGKLLDDEAYVTVDLPDASTMQSFDTLELDLTMDCEHHRDGECGAWDYLANLYVCDPASSNGGGDAGDDAGVKPVCDTEIGRWITSYWREARWVTDVSSMLPLLQSGKQTFRWAAGKQWDPKPAKYVVSLSLRLSNTGKGMRPASVKKLWTGGEFDADYPSLHPKTAFDVPAGTKKVEIYALVTGHGADTSHCAEFCNHTHHFAVNGKSHDIDFPEAGNQDGCRKRVAEGVAPNQWGTWYLGRGGWCPGFDVRPFVFDVTGDATAASNELTYHALVGTSELAPGVKYGNIDLTSYLVFWR